MKKLEASALPTVLVISVIVLLIILFAYALWDMSALYYSTYHYHKQQQENLNSASLLYCNDSTLLNSLGKENEYTLYKDDNASTIYYDIKRWGLYECLTISSNDRSHNSVRFIGKNEEGDINAAFWLCDRDRALLIAGNTSVEGSVYIPKNGINYIELNRIPYSGEMLIKEDMHLSDKNLPKVDTSYIDYINGLRNVDITTQSTGISNHYVSFRNETVHRLIPNITERYTARGNVVLHGEEVIISSDAILSDIILIARKVTIEAGFEGSLQVFATDTVIIKENVHLKYPSGIHLKGNNKKTHLDIGRRSKIDGYAIVFGVGENVSSFIPDINYHQQEDATLRGLLYVDGIANLKGDIYGSAYLAECYYLSGEIMYASTLFNIKIRRNSDIAYPMLFAEGKYKRKEIKSGY